MGDGWGGGVMVVEVMSFFTFECNGMIVDCLNILMGKLLKAVKWIRVSFVYVHVMG